MNQQRRRGFDECGKASGTAISRRAAMGCSGAAVLGLLSGPTLGQEAVLVLNGLLD